MAGHVGGFLGGLIGALLITFILTRLTNYIAQKKANPEKAALIAFYVVAVVSFLIISFTMGIGKWLIIYFPCLILWLIIDLRRTRTNRIRREFKCIHCGTEYNPEDYRNDALEWFCPHCGKPLQEE